jgi:hypothetical protein
VKSPVRLPVFPRRYNQNRASPLTELIGDRGHRQARKLAKADLGNAGQRRSRNLSNISTGIERCRKDIAGHGGLWAALRLDSG